MCVKKLISFLKFSEFILDVKEKIIKIAREEFVRLGFRNVRVDELSQKIGISKRTLYEHFRTKEELFEAIIDIELERVKSFVENIIEFVEKNPQANLIEEINKMWQLNANSAIEFTREFIDDMQKYTPHIWDIIYQFRQKVIEITFSRIFKIGVEKGFFRSDVNAEVLFHMHLTLVQNLVTPSMIMRLQASPKEIMETIINVVFRGVLTDEARQKYADFCKKICSINFQES